MKPEITSPTLKQPIYDTKVKEEYYSRHCGETTNALAVTAVIILSAFIGLLLGKFVMGLL